MAANGSPVLPGRLGSPDMTLRDDPRADPRMLAAMEPFGLGNRPPRRWTASPIEEPPGVRGRAEEGFEAMFAAIGGEHARCRGRRAQRRGHPRRRRQRHHAVPPPSGRRRRPAARHAAPARRRHGHARGGGGQLRAVARRAGGAGMVVVGVEFRNGGGKHGPFPFPAGLERLRVGAAVGHRQQGEARHHQARSCRASRAGGT